MCCLLVFDVHECCRFMGQSSRRDERTIIDNSRLKEMGFEYKYDFKKIIDDSVACGQRLGALL